MNKKRVAAVIPPRATDGLRLMMRLYKPQDITNSPEWQTLRYAVEELDRLYKLELVAEHACCSREVSHLDTLFEEGDCSDWQKPVEKETVER